MWRRLLVVALLAGAGLDLSGRGRADVDLGPQGTSSRFQSFTVTTPAAVVQPGWYKNAAYYYPKITLLQMIQYAYGVSNLRVEGGPDWMRTTPWAVEGHTPAPVFDEDVRMAMVRAALEERFGLKVQLQLRRVPALVLTRTSRPSVPDRFTTSNVDCRLFRANQQSYADSPKDASGIRLCLSIAMTKRDGRDFNILNNADFPTLAMRLEGVLHRLVVDQTGLKGRYTLAIEMPDQYSADAPDKVDEVIQTMRTQLGLTLQQRVSEITMVAVQSVTKPRLDSIEAAK